MGKKLTIRMMHLLVSFLLGPRSGQTYITLQLKVGTCWWKPRRFYVLCPCCAEKGEIDIWLQVTLCRALCTSQCISAQKGQPLSAKRTDLWHFQAVPGREETTLLSGLFPPICMDLGLTPSFTILIYLDSTAEILPGEFSWNL